MNQEERENVEEFHFCKNIAERDDVVFVFPAVLDNTSSAVADKMQEAICFIKRITDIDPTRRFGKRIVVGYRHPDDYKGDKKNPIIAPERNRISIPWSYLGRTQEPLKVCSHEFVHPFFRCSRLQENNSEWDEPFTYFLQGPVMERLGLCGEAHWQGLVVYGKKDKESFRVPAGEFVKNACKEFDATIGHLVRDDELIAAYIQSLFSRFEKVSLSEYISPVPKMRKH